MLKRFALNYCAAFVGVGIGDFIRIGIGAPDFRSWQYYVFTSLLMALLFAAIDAWRERKKCKQAALERLILLTIGALYPNCGSLQVQRYLESQGYMDTERVYTAMGKLEELGLIASERRRNGPDCPPEMNAYRYVYWLTEAGKERLAKV